MHLWFNTSALFTRWVVSAGLLERPFVVVDVGVQGAENSRWHLLGDYLVVQGFDAIEEVIGLLRRKNANYPNRHYHWLAAGSADEERAFYVNEAESTSSSFYAQGDDRFGLRDKRDERARMVTVRRLDTLLAEGIIPAPDFLKCDVEGFEKEVFLGASRTLRTVLGVEVETSFSISPLYPKTHFVTVQELLLEARLLPFDLNFNRVPRASFVAAVKDRRKSGRASLSDIGKPATFNVLFCRDLIDEADHSEHYTSLADPVEVDQLIKLMVIYELHRLNDVALDTAVRFADRLAGRFDVDKAIYLLADPNCRRGALSSIRLWPLRTLPMRALRKAGRMMRPKRPPPTRQPAAR
ncbi:MAG TPA: FkbM family methyltransferase [Stellaceae bacterium]|nr:FkbM family methyltransferase [Stellaceae bacterium]